jgi:hypothetical protein
VARRHGVACDDAAPLASGSNVLVHLRPAPVVARVMTGTALLHPDPERWLTREVAVGRFLVGRGAVAPSDLLPPGPHVEDGLWMTFWAFVAHEDRAPDLVAAGRALRKLHTALAAFPGELEPLSAIRDWLLRLLDEVRLPPADVDWLRARLEASAAFASALPVQPLHGDASLSNLLRTDRGLLWNDFEDVCVGPVEWDLAGLSGGRREVLDGYGPAGDLEPFLEAHGLYDVIWQAFEARRRPAAMERATASLRALRSSAFRRR